MTEPPCAHMEQLATILDSIADGVFTVDVERRITSFHRAAEERTGKELLTKAVHDLNSRKDGPLVVINCGALPETLLEAEIFGGRQG